MKIVLKALRKIYTKIWAAPKLPELEFERDSETVSTMLYNLLASDVPCMIARLGYTELQTMVNYLGIKQGPEIINYIKGKALDWWWHPERLNAIKILSGFFPPTSDCVSKFCELMLEDTKCVDILGSWVKEEYYVQDYLINARKVQLSLLEPYFSTNPWTRVLKGKNVLVVHPFAETIERQYQKRHLLFENQDVMPDFNLFTITAVQSIGGELTNFSDWFEALQCMEDEIDKIQYDICLIGCGAYGFPLAAHVKRQGKKAVHLGGALQLLFGIRGKRWEDPNLGVSMGVPPYFYLNLMNDYWVRPGDNLRPQGADNFEKAHQTEGGCYW